MRSLALALMVLPLAGCTGPLARAESQFTQGRYPDAKQALMSLEAESRTWPDAQRAEYALYRGLTHAALGDKDQAAVWLREAKAIEETHSGSLSREDDQRLKVGFDALGPD